MKKFKGFNPVSHLRPHLLYFATVIWAGLVGVGGYLMFAHEFAGIVEEEVSNEWPVDLMAFQPSGCNLTVVMAVHPHCPCTRASLEQLYRVLSQYPDATEAFVLVHADSDHTDTQIHKSRYWQKISAMQGAIPVIDVEGQLADQFNLTLSGSVAAYDKERRLRYHGGITPSRGHEGSCPGLSMLLAVAKGQETPTGVAGISFGCPLGDE